jgi:hypothetical protein
MMQKFRAACFSAFVALVLVACGDGEPTTHNYVDDGNVCVRAADGLLTVAVLHPGCLSSSCDTLRDSSCVVTVQGSDVTISSRFVVEQAGAEQCTSDCVRVSTSCSASLADGTYTLSYGDQQGTVTAPLESTPVFGESGPCP